MGPKGSKDTKKNHTHIGPLAITMKSGQKNYEYKIA